MKVLTFRNLLSGIIQLQKEHNLTDLELADIPIIIGDDEELNGVHEAYFIQAVNTKEAKGYTWKDLEEKKVDFDEYCKYSLQQDVKDQTNIDGLCILIS